MYFQQQAAPCSITTSPSRAHGPHAPGGSDGCRSVVKVRRTKERMASTWPMTFTAREWLLGRTDEQSAPGQHVRSVGGRRGWNSSFKQGFHSKNSLKQVCFKTMLTSCSALGKSEQAAPLWATGCGVPASLVSAADVLLPPQPRRDLACPWQSVERDQRPQPKWPLWGAAMGHNIPVPVLQWPPFCG